MTTTRRLRCRFDEAKATQVAAILVRKAGGKLSHISLAKLTYIIDREAFSRWGRPVIGGSYYSLPHGPVISQIVDLMRRIEGWDNDSVWTRHLTKIGNEMQLIEPVGNDELSPAELNVIDEVFDTFGTEKWELRDKSHQFGEWIDPHGSRLPISITDILFEVGKSPKEIAQIADELRELQEMDELLGA
jgi:uncharacterized phage-associated protein